MPLNGLNQGFFNEKHKKDFYKISFNIPITDSVVDIMGIEKPKEMTGETLIVRE